MVNELKGVVGRYPPMGAPKVARLFPATGYGGDVGLFEEHNKKYSKDNIADRAGRHYGKTTCPENIYFWDELSSVNVVAPISDSDFLDLFC